MIVMSNFASTAALMNRRIANEKKTNSQYKVNRIHGNGIVQFGVWANDGRSLPVQIFNTEAEANEFAFGKK